MMAEFFGNFPTVQICYHENTFFGKSVGKISKSALVPMTSPSITMRTLFSLKVKVRIKKLRFVMRTLLSGITKSVFSLKVRVRLKKLPVALIKFLLNTSRTASTVESKEN